MSLSKMLLVIANAAFRQIKCERNAAENEVLLKTIVINHDKSRTGWDMLTVSQSTCSLNVLAVIHFSALARFLKTQTVCAHSMFCKVSKYFPRLHNSCVSQSETSVILPVSQIHKNFAYGDAQTPPYYVSKKKLKCTAYPD